MSFHRDEIHARISLSSPDDYSSVSSPTDHEMPLASEGLSLISPPQPQRATSYQLQESCLFRNFPNRRSSHLRFLAWVAYKRKYANTITVAERQTCPLLCCQEIFHDEDTMLQHVWNCQHLSKGLYWCYDCQRLERVGKFQCRRCRQGPSKTDRLANVAKKIFSLLGTRAAAHRGYSCQKSLGKPQPPSLSKGNADYSQASNSYETPSIPGTFEEIQWPELDSTAVAEPVELASPIESPTAHLNMSPSEMGDQTDYSEHAVPSRRGSCKAPFDLMEKGPAVAEEPWMCATAHGSPNFSPPAPNLRLNTQFGSQPQHADSDLPPYWPVQSAYPIISPLSPTAGIDPSRLSISPTDSESSKNSFNTDSGYTSATSMSRGSASSTAHISSWKTGQARPTQNLSAISEVFDRDVYPAEQPMYTESSARGEFRNDNYSQQMGSMVSPVEYSSQGVEPIPSPPQLLLQPNEDMSIFFDSGMTMDRSFQNESVESQAHDYLAGFATLKHQGFAGFQCDDNHGHDQSASQAHQAVDHGLQQEDVQARVEALAKEADEIPRHTCDNSETCQLTSYSPMRPVSPRKRPSSRRMPQPPVAPEHFSSHRVSPRIYSPKPTNPYRRRLNMKPNTFHQPPPRNASPPAYAPLTYAVFSPPAPPPSTPLPVSTSLPQSATSFPSFPSSPQPQAQVQAQPQSQPQLQRQQPIPPPCPTPPFSSSQHPPTSPLSRGHTLHRCNICGWAPGGKLKYRQTNLRRHIRTTHLGTRFLCRFPGCPKSFSRTDNLRAHWVKVGHGGVEVLLRGLDRVGSDGLGMDGMDMDGLCGQRCEGGGGDGERLLEGRVGMGGGLAMGMRLETGTGTGSQRSRPVRRNRPRPLEEMCFEMDGS